MPVQYTNPETDETFVFTPAPLVEIKKTYVTDNTGNILYSKYSFTLTGTIISLNTSEFDMTYVVEQQKNIREALNKQGGRLEIISPITTNDPTGGATIDAFVMLEDITFQSDVWNRQCKYSIVFSSIGLADSSEVNEDGLVSKQENWSIEEQPDSFYNISHVLEAVGLLLPSGDGGFNNPSVAAKNWCANHLYSIDSNGSLDKEISPMVGIPFLSSVSGSLNFWNYSLTEGVGTTANSWSATEKFIYVPSGNSWREEWSTAEQIEGGALGNSSINCNGTVYGLAAKNFDLTTRLNNAILGWNSVVLSNIYTRLTAYYGGTINPTPKTRQVTYNHGDGSVQYSFTYNKLGTTLIDGAIEENISVSDVGPVDVFASIPIPGRAYGPVIQYMNTQTAPQRTINISATIPQSGFELVSLRARYNAKPNVDNLLRALTPSNGNYYMTANNEEWNPINGQYSRVMSWTLEQISETTAVGVPSGVHGMG